MSFSEARFPKRFKSVPVTPLLKGDSLNKASPSSYRPISDLCFILKVLERLFLHRFLPHILENSNYNRCQSAYRSSHSIDGFVTSARWNFSCNRQWNVLLVGVTWPKWCIWHCWPFDTIWPTQSQLRCYRHGFVMDSVFT